MPDTTPLSATYDEARSRFIDAAAAAGATVESTAHPNTGLHGEALSVEVAQLGDPSAAVALLIVSGTHGVEGYCGSALQSHWLHRVADGTIQLPPNTRVVMVHALNPFGFSWVRRTNEDNIDLNRNFLDWDGPMPLNEDYDRIAEVLVPHDRTPEGLAAADGALVSWVMDVGMEVAQQAISGGQYRWPGGVFYGGTEAAWSNLWLRTLFEHELANADAIGIIDLHTGLGDWGHGELISSLRTGDPGLDRARRWWGDVRSMVEGESVSASLAGDWLNVVATFAPQADVTAAALEFGTVDLLEVITALRSDAWLHSGGDPLGPEADAVRAQVRHAFVDDSPEWFETVWNRFETVAAQALAGLAR